MDVRRRAIWCVAAVSLLLVAATAPRTQAPAGWPYAEAHVTARYADAIHKAEAALQSYMSGHGVPGLSIAVGVDGRLVWSEGFGLADVEQNTMVTPLTRFRSGSVAKTVTGVATALLYEQGRLDLDAPIQ